MGRCNERQQQCLSRPTIKARFRSSSTRALKQLQLVFPGLNTHFFSVMNHGRIKHGAKSPVPSFSMRSSFFLPRSTIAVTSQLHKVFFFIRNTTTDNLPQAQTKKQQQRRRRHKPGILCRASVSDLGDGGSATKRDLKNARLDS